MTTRDLVLAHLREEKIRLWLPPYHRRGGGDDASDDEALTALAESLERMLAAPNENSNDQSDCGGAAAGEIRETLAELRSHAVQKWKDKHSVDVKIVTSRLAATHLSESDGGAADGARETKSAFSGASWGDEISIVRDGDNALRLRVTNLSPTLTVSEFSSDVCRALNAKTARVIWKGKNLTSASGSAGDGEMDSLRKLLAATSISGSNNTGGDRAAASSQKKKGELLCLVSGTGYVAPAASPDSSAATAAAGDPGVAAPSPVRTDTSVIESIRAAARTIQNSPRGSRFEVTDQSGNLVSMCPSDTVAFLTALGLHRIGRSKMEGRRNDGSGDGASSDPDAASALVFLLEADAEWNASPALQLWKPRVDNYGLLQLDIAWCYLLLESLDGLDDAVRRLDVAERALRKQVHSNFVTLALAQAEADNPIPPLCAIFVRLFLLQGVANRTRHWHDRGSAGDDGLAAAEERLSWARLLCHRLRSSSPTDSVEELCRAYAVDPPTAVAALRRTNGDPDAAGNLIAADRDDEGRAARKRRRQQRAGRCANGADFVDLDLVPSLSSMLGYGDGVDCDLGEDEDGDIMDGLPTGALIAIGLLRLSDNSIDGALELYGTFGADQVMERVARLDEASGRRKRRSKRGAKPDKHQVRDMELTMLVSMGVEEAKGRAALKATGNVESALLWLSKDDVGQNDVKIDCATGNDAASLARDGRLAGAPGDSMINGGDDEASDAEEKEVSDANELLEREIGNALGTDSKQVFEKEWLGADMRNEWDLIEKYA